jgi:hypothetical protein
VAQAALPGWLDFMMVGANTDGRLVAGEPDMADRRRNFRSLSDSRIRLFLRRGMLCGAEF